MTRKRVLIVAYYFPPSGGPGVQRILKFIRYLPEFGWDPAVLTVRDADYPAQDETLLAEIPETVPVVRTAIPEPYSIYRRLLGQGKGTPVDVNVNTGDDGTRSFKEKLAEWVRGTFFIPDARVGWLVTGTAAGINLARNFGADIVYSSSPPYTCALLGRAVAKRAGIAWVPEFRDPWSGFLSAPRRPEPSRTIERRLEHGVYRDAPGIVVAWKGIAADFAAKYPTEDSGKFMHIANGFDPEDFKTVSPKQNNRFTVVYTGSMYGVRSPDIFLKAVSQAVSSGAVDPGKICLRFVGRFGDEVREMFRREEVAPMVEEYGYVSHSESVAEILGAHALLLVIDDFPGSAEIVPGKVFEYLGAKRPIIALGGEGVVGDLVKETGAGWFCDRSNIAGVTEVFVQLYEEWNKTGATRFRGDPVQVERLSRRERTRELSEFLARVVEKRHGA